MNGIRTSFLERVARVYASIPADTLADTCFVLPNKRSISFLRQHLSRIKGNEPFIEPAMMDISHFVAGFTLYDEASRYEMLFTLYSCYARLNKDAETPFDKFLFWGEMLVNDFNDVDRYLVNPDSLFTNLERLKEIGSTYLTAEQIEIIRRYWDMEDIEEETGRFWRHIDKDAKGSKARFIKLWEVLGPLYHDYIDSLNAMGLTTRGAMYREASEKISREGASALHYNRYVFVGFNVLTTSELKIFRCLKAMDRADFFWDFNSPALHDPTNKAGRFIRKNMEEFPPPASFDDEPATSLPDIDIIGVPSNTGQAKVAGEIVSKWVKEGLVGTKRGNVNTAIVLPDEALFLPLIHSMPAEVDEMNVTMGFPMRLSPIAALIGNIWRLQRNARRISGRVDCYYFEDVRNLLAMPTVRDLDPDGASAILKAIKEERLFTVQPSVIQNLSSTLFQIFIPLDRNTPPDGVAEHITRLTDFLLETTDADSDKLRVYFLESYRTAVQNLREAVRHFNMGMDAFTFLHMIERAVRGDTVNFVGEPLSGLQIMGMLETRALDFDNLIILSMNERVFPRRQMSRSFIPDVLRRGYGMSTTDFSESIFAYYFYRLLSRAKRVTLMYDSRTIGGTRSSEMSRYLVQLLYLYPHSRMQHISAVFRPPLFRYPVTEITKTPRIMELLHRFTRDGSGFSLSASSINTYINCPLQFYLQYVERFMPDDDPVDYVDYSTYGQIVHQTLENFYKALSAPGKEARVTPELVRLLTRDDYPLMDQLLLEAINNNFHNIHNPSRYRKLAGETAILATVIKRNILDLFAAESELGEFSFKAAEKKLTGRLELAPGINVNIKQVIDRIDCIDNVAEAPGTRLMRIVDYKTGSDPLTAKCVDEMFDSALPDRPKAMMQLFFYCMFYSAITGYDDAIQPIIYSMRSVVKSGIKPLELGGQPLMDYRTYLEPFARHLASVIEELFDPTIPFRPAKHEHSCTFCKFKTLCSRGEKS
ncbi:MAG: PD-(D/E)XK nuclease family protein [Muribaculaceae bacterium]|nr:PD-(D/E)XK nuclease family protein [Muribaculaceae bacterium]